MTYKDERHEDKDDTEEVCVCADKEHQQVICTLRHSARCASVSGYCSYVPRDSKLES